HHARLVTDWLEKLGDGDLAVAETVTINTGHKGSSGRPATGSIVKLCEAQAVLGQLVEVRGVDFASETAKIGKTHIVSKNDEDVRPVRGVTKKRKVEEEKERKNIFHG
ncbi:uncharacterized protein METZ01_LOCUS501899, partial [marine metagenome]